MRPALRIGVSTAATNAVAAIGVNGPLVTIRNGVDTIAIERFGTVPKSNDVFIAATKNGEMGRAIAAELEDAGVGVDLACELLPRELFLRRMGRCSVALLLLTHTRIFLPALEAMVLGCAVVIPAIDGISDFCANGSTCRSTAYEPGALTQAAIEVIRDAALAEASYRSAHRCRRVFARARAPRVSRGTEALSRKQVTMSDTQPVFVVVAHPDDWQLFMGADVYAYLREPRNRVVFVVTTAGDAGRGELHWKWRLNGAVLSVLRALPSWSPYETAEPGALQITYETATVNGKRVLVCSIADSNAASIRMYLLNLPDGGKGAGFAPGFQSLSRLRRAELPLQALWPADEPPLYRDWDDFVAMLSGIIVAEGAGEQAVPILSTDPDAARNPGDHSDHQMTSAAVAELAQRHAFLRPVWYCGYSNAAKPENLGDADANAQRAAIYAYGAGYMAAAAGFGDTWRASWEREYPHFKKRQYRFEVPIRCEGDDDGLGRLDGQGGGFKEVDFFVLARSEMPSEALSVSPRVAIVVLNWNGWRDTVECLESILRSDHAIAQIVVCDNGSTDDSVLQLRQWASRVPCASADYDPQIGAFTSGDAGASIVFVQIAANLGYGGGNNVGIRYALDILDVRYVWLLNNDTVVDRHALSHLVELAQSDPSLGVIGAKLLSYREPSKIQALGGGSISRSGIDRQIGRDCATIRARTKRSISTTWWAPACSCVPMPFGVSALSTNATSSSAKRPRGVSRCAKPLGNSSTARRRSCGTKRVLRLDTRANCTIITRFGISSSSYRSISHNI